MIRVIDILTPEERAACEACGRAALDAALARLTDADRAAIWHSIRQGYVQPAKDGGTLPSPAPQPPAAEVSIEVPAGP